MILGALWRCRVALLRSRAALVPENDQLLPEELKGRRGRWSPSRRWLVGLVAASLLTSCWPQDVEISKISTVGPIPLVLKFEQPIIARYSRVSVCAEVGKGFALLPPGSDIRGPDGKTYSIQAKLTFASGHDCLLPVVSLLLRGTKGDLACLRPGGGISLAGNEFQSLEISSIPALVVDGVFFMSYAPK